jgi:hypothetical protein
MEGSGRESQAFLRHNVLVHTLRGTVNKLPCYLGNSGEGKYSCLDEIIMYEGVGEWGTERDVWV